MGSGNAINAINRYGKILCNSIVIYYAVQVLQNNIMGYKIELIYA